MRTFYVFRIKDEFKTITENKPYNLFLTLDNIRCMPTTELNIATSIYDMLCINHDKGKMNLEIFKLLKDSDYYTKYNNNHMINNYYTTEKSKLTVNNTYLKIETTSMYPYFLKLLKNYKNLFIADFEEKDYFWLS